jgi:aspartyl-tRNA(Asn)/glutamyl-tRNA(Gln) amidotransferase subunit C
MSLSAEEVNHIALLARLDLSETEKAKAATELSQILDSFEKLKELNTENVTPAESALNLVNVLRADEKQPSLPTKAALANAPEQAAGMFVVPRVVEAE